jgi:putative signal transducing protein
MQMVYRAKDLSDADNVRAMLTGRGIAAHVASPAGEVGRVALGYIRVSVDNVQLDAARRAIAAWQRKARANLDQLQLVRAAP